jgi:hypothetical protein
MSNPKYQTNSNEQNFKIQTMSCHEMFWSRAAQELAPRVGHWNLKFICNLMLGFWTFSFPSSGMKKRHFCMDTK